jgi:hypothetical protein
VHFTGEILADESSRLTSGQENNRWHEARVYRTKGGQYVVEVVYCTQWQGENYYHWVLEAGAPSSVEMRLREIGCEICNPVKGYPPSDHYADKQARLIHDIQQRFEVLVSEVLGSSEDFREELA